MSIVKKLLIILMVFVFFGCQTEAKKRKIQEEIKNLDYKNISMEINFGDDVEVHKYEEYVSGIDDSLKFRLADKLINETGEGEIVRYELTEIDTKNEICVKHQVAFLAESDSAAYYRLDTLMEKVESRSYYIDKKEFSVYKIQEIDEFMGSCNTSIVSPDFGFLFGKGSVGDFEISQRTENEVVGRLIDIIKRDTVFINCNKNLLEISNSIDNHHRFHNH